MIGLLNGFALVYAIMTTGSTPAMMVSAHSHFLCMSTIILVVGLMMKNWAGEIEKERVAPSGWQLTSAKASVALLVLGNIVAFAFYAAQMPQPGLIGDILYFVGFVVVAVGFIMGARVYAKK